MRPRSTSLPVKVRPATVNGTLDAVPDALKFSPVPSNARCRYSARRIHRGVRAHSMPIPAAQPPRVADNSDEPPVNFTPPAGQEPARVRQVATVEVEVF